MIDLGHNRQFHFGYIALGLLLSLVAPALCLQVQEEEAVDRLCVSIGPYENQINACMQNRILQLQSVIGLDDGQVKRLRIVSKGVLEREAKRVDDTFYYGNPILSKFWESNMDRVLSEQQRVKVAEFDEQVIARQQQARIRYGRKPHDSTTKASFVAANLQVHLHLSNDQTQQVSQLLKNHLDELEGKRWDPMLDAFYESKQEELELVLAESQRLFFDGNSLINGIGDRTVWDTQWRKASCTDCHWG